MIEVFYLSIFIVILNAGQQEYYNHKSSRLKNGKSNIGNHENIVGELPTDDCPRNNAGVRDMVTIPAVSDDS